VMRGRGALALEVPGEEEEDARAHGEGSSARLALALRWRRLLTSSHESKSASASAEVALMPVLRRLSRKSALMISPLPLVSQSLRSFLIMSSLFTSIRPSWMGTGGAERTPLFSSASISFRMTAAVLLSSSTVGGAARTGGGFLSDGGRGGAW
jgi:hypothetical protein